MNVWLDPSYLFDMRTYQEEDGAVSFEAHYDFNTMPMGSIKRIGYGQCHGEDIEGELYSHNVQNQRITCNDF